MKWLLCSFLFVSFHVSAKEITPSLKASIMTARELEPALYKQIKTNLSVIKTACTNAPKLIAKASGKGAKLTTKKDFERDKALVQNMPMHISNALENEIKLIDRSISTEGLCLETLFKGNLLGFAEKEALEYLRGVQADVKKKDYRSCATKLDKLLQVGGK